MKFLQKLGKALMLPVAVLPICGILMGIGYFLCPATMQGGDIEGVRNLIGLFLVKAGGALIDNMAILFVIGVGVGMSEKNDGTGGIAALASWLMMTTLLSTGFVTTIMPSIADSATKTLAFDKIANPFIGILAGVIGSLCYNRFKDTKLPDWLSFFSGKRCVAIIAGVVSILVSVVLLFVWPLLFGALVSIGKAIVGFDVVGAGIYAFLNRLLIPTGLHHALNNVFWFDTIGLGDLSHFWAGETSKDVSWSLGMYMSGFFPCMMFGIPGAALAMVKCAKTAKKKAAIGILASAAISVLTVVLFCLSLKIFSNIFLPFLLSFLQLLSAFPATDAC
jgi:PTS system N-acetylglucosamine-specific IIC component